jgi:hypothetical protein
VARAVPPVIKDDAKFFGPEAVQKANDLIKEITRKSGKDLLIETVPAVPADQLAKVKGMSHEERDRFFSDWANQRVKDAVVNGVYILVTKEPAHVQVEVTPQARSVFDRRTRDQLIQILLTKFREKKFDEGLLDAVRFVNEKAGNAGSERKE